MQLPCYFPVACHTDNVGPGTTFVVIKGRAQDGMDYGVLAIEKGARTLVFAHDVVLSPALTTLIEEKQVRVERVDDTRRALAELSAAATGYPAQKLHIIGITGTKGKTTSTFLLEHMFRTAGYKTALLSTVKNSIVDHQFSTNLTTQQPDYLHVFFDLCVQAGVTHVIMEVAAQALTLHRTWGLVFDGLLFTNFDREHAEFYSTQQDYFQAKYRIFAQRGAGAPVVVNADDAKGKAIVEQHPDFIAYSLEDTSAAYYSSIVGAIGQQVALEMRTPDGAVYQMVCPALLGKFNAYNVQGALTLAVSLGLPIQALHRACMTFPGVPGRMERYVLNNGAVCYIDYAHNPSSYDNLLSLLRSLTSHLIVVFGAGGERDQEKRPLMGALAGRYADEVVLTSDNPRSEDPNVILDQVQSGMHTTSAHVMRILDRAAAITYACSRTNTGSIVAVLGKGSEEYQMIGKVKYFFSDRRVVRACGQDQNKVVVEGSNAVVSLP